MYTGNNLDNVDKEKLILMLQVRQVISLVTSHLFWLSKTKRLEIYFSMLYLFLVLTLTKILTVH